MKYHGIKTTRWKVYRLTEKGEFGEWEYLGTIVVTGKEVDEEMSRCGIAHHEPVNIAERKGMKLAMAKTKEGGVVRLRVEEVRKR
jgi:hypothetical protein